MLRFLRILGLLRILFFIFVLTPILLIVPWISGIKNVIVVMAGVFLWFIMFNLIIVKFGEIIDGYYFKYIPCKHGIRGAQYNIEICPECTAEKERIDKEEEQKKELEIIETKRRELEKYNAWVNNVRETEYLLTMNPDKFEELVCHLFEKIGYKTELTPITGDHGIDAYLYSENEKIVLQCKRVKNKVGEPVIRDLFGAMHDTKSNYAILVTTGKVSKQAHEWIKDKPIRIIELLELRKLINQYFPIDVKILPDIKPIMGKSMNCPLCGNHLRMINGKRGAFLGCMSYPACTYTRSVSNRKPWE